MAWQFWRTKTALPEEKDSGSSFEESERLEEQSPMSEPER